jgi:hypothetical protein
MKIAPLQPRTEHSPQRLKQLSLDAIPADGNFQGSQDRAQTGPAIRELEHIHVMSEIRFDVLMESGLRTGESL